MYALDAVPNLTPWRDRKKAASGEVQPPQGSRPTIGVKQRNHQVVEEISVQGYVQKVRTDCSIIGNLERQAGQKKEA